MARGKRGRVLLVTSFVTALMLLYGAAAGAAGPLEDESSSGNGPGCFYFAEGTTRPDFETYFCILSPEERDAEVRLTYMRVNGTVEEQFITVPATSRVTLSAKDRLGSAADESCDFSTKVESLNGATILAERSMYFNYRGIWSGGHSTIGAEASSFELFFAEGCTRPGFDTYFCIMNPHGRSAEVTLTYMRGEGDPVEQKVTVPATSRKTVFANGFLGSAESQAHDFSVELDADGVGVVAERSAYFEYRGAWTGGHVVMGRPRILPRTGFSEGTTRPGFDTYLCIMNPVAKEADVELTYYRGDGTAEVQVVTVPASSRYTVFPEEILGSSQDAASDFSTTVRTLGDDVGIVVERPMYFNYRGWCPGGNTSIPPINQYVSMDYGIYPTPSIYYFPEGSVRPDFDSYLCVLNYTEADREVVISYVLGDGAVREQVAVIPALSRKTIVVKDFLGSADDPAHDFAAAVSGAGMVVERSTYFNYRGLWPGGHGAFGYRDWYMHIL